MTKTINIKLNKRFYSLAGVVLALIAAVIFSLVYFGVYNVSALTGHTTPVYKFLEHARIQAVDARVDEQVPDLTLFDWQRSGLKNYQRHCIACHGAPGVAPEPFSLGMMPPPSAIVRVAGQRSPAELYWVIENGIKMSGMPAWKYRLTQEELWELVALVKVLPTLSKAEYAQLADHNFAIEGVESVLANQQDETAIMQSSLAEPRATQALSGQVAMQQYNCSSCHVIDGIASASYHVGPPLNNMVNRRFIVGTLPTTRENLIQWIMDPPHFKPQSLMPNLRVKRNHAEAMVDYLYEIADEK
jgi:mono/diheme cytochrome c family protein